MEDLKVKAEAAGEEVKESFKEGAAAFVDDVAMNKHNVDEISDERKAEKEAKKAERKARYEGAMAAIVESFRDGIAELKSDAAFTKETVGEVSSEHKAEKAAKKMAKREQLDLNMAEMKASAGKGAEEWKADGEALVSSLKDIAADAGIDVRENEAVSEWIKVIKDSFADGFEAMKSDASFTKETVEEVSAEHKAEKAMKKHEKQVAFEENMADAKKSFEDGAAAFRSDAAATKEAVDTLSAEHKAEKAAKKEEKREKFDAGVEDMKEALK